jgi:hypothetical protein
MLHPRCSLYFLGPSCVGAPQPPPFPFALSLHMVHNAVAMLAKLEFPAWVRLRTPSTHRWARTNTAHLQSTTFGTFQTCHPIHPEHQWILNACLPARSRATVTNFPHVHFLHPYTPYLVRQLCLLELLIKYRARTSSINALPLTYQPLCIMCRFHARSCPCSELL